MRISTATFALTLFAISGLACAQNTSGSRSQEGLVSGDYVVILGGVPIPDNERGVKQRGFTLSWIYGNQLSTHFAVEGQIQYSIFKRATTATTDFYQWGGTVDLVYGLTDRRTSPVTPYVLVGVGSVFDDVFSKHGDGAAFMYEGGVGLVTKSLYHGIRLRGEGRYNRDFFDRGYNDYRALLGIEIPLGRVIERVIEVPAPSPPVVTEVIKEVPRPWIDSDGDGVDDEHDLCPNTPKGLKVDAHGCVIPGQEIALNGVTFEFNKARLMANAQTILDTIAPAFIGQPTLKVEIGGHTDSIGGAAYNLKLSQQRADAVREYLISKGAKPEQLTAVGYGKTQPLITPEKTADDRERNRRVAFRVLDK